MVLNSCDEPEDAADWIEAVGSTHPVLCDSEETAWDLYGVGMGKPQYILLDREMNIVYRGMGPGDYDTAESRVIDLL